MLDSGLKQSQSLNVPAAKESIKDSKPIKSSPVRKAQKSTDLGTKKAKPTKTSKKPEGKPISVKWTSKEKPNHPHIEDKIEPEIEEEPEKEAKQQVKAPVAKTKAQLEQEEQIRNLFDEQDQQQQDVVAPPTKDESEALQPPQLEQSEPTTGARKRVRKKRRVMKKQTALEGKYMVTKDVEVSESYSEDEQPIVQFNPKAKKSKVVQKSLKSFFQKK